MSQGDGFEREIKVNDETGENGLSGVEPKADSQC